MNAEQPKRNRAAVGVLVAVIVVVVALVAAVAVWVFGDKESASTAEGEATVQETSPTSPDSPRSSSRGESVTADGLGREVTVVDEPAGIPKEQKGQPGTFADGETLVAPPSGYALQRLPSGVTVAVSESDGPTRVEDGAMTGYARSPQGAGLLAINYTGFGMSMSQATKDFMVSVVPESERAAAADAEGYGPEEESRTRDYLASGYAAPQRIRLRECSEEFCTVEVATPSIQELAGEIDADTDPAMHTVTRVSMKWEDQAWSIVETTAQQLREFDESWGSWR